MKRRGAFVQVGEGLESIQFAHDGNNGVTTTCRYASGQVGIATIQGGAARLDLTSICQNAAGFLVDYELHTGS